MRKEKEEGRREEKKERLAIIRSSASISLFFAQLQPLPLNQAGETTSFRKMEAGVPVDVPTSTARVADATACATLSLTGSDECSALRPGDVFRLSGGLFTLDKAGRASLRAGRRGTLERLGFGDFVFVEGPDMSNVGYEREESGGSGSGGGGGVGGYRPRAPLPTKFWQPPSLAPASSSK